MAFSFYSCQKEISVPDEEAELIFGDWEWYRSVNTGWYSESTPASEGYSIEVIIERTGRYTSYQGAEEYMNEKFTIVKDPELSWPTPYRLEFKNNTALTVYKLSEDTIAFYPYEFNDGSISYYKRKN